MKYEKTNETAFLGKWRYQVQLACFFDWVDTPKGNREQWRTPNDLAQIRHIEAYLGRSAHGAWQRVGNNFYLMELNDAFTLRLYFDDVVRFVREAGSFHRQPSLAA